MSITTWTAAGLTAEFVQIHRTLPDRGFCFLLGAGASKQSGIPTGIELVDRWLREIREREFRSSSESMQEWATPSTLDIPDFNYDDRATFYPQVYRRRFSHDRLTGYAYLEDLIEGREPSFGYVVLARILSDGRHNAVVTTNFDNLVSRALSIFTGTTARAIGHERLAEFASPSSKRPLIAKVHRDLLLQPWSTPEEISDLPDDWKDALSRILRQYSPLVIGYGGNDGSLMSYLESFQEDHGFRGPLIWCQLHGQPISERIQDLLDRSGGILVYISGFDEIMLLLGEQLGFLEFERPLRRQSEEAIRRLNEQLSQLKRELREQESEDPDTRSAREALDSIVRTEIASLRTPPDDTEQDQSDLIDLGKKLIVDGQWDEALQVFERVLDINKTLNQRRGQAITLLNIGRAYEGMGKLENAEKYYLESLELNQAIPSLEGQSIVYGMLGALYEEMQQKDQAMDAFRRALAIDREIGRTAGVVFNSGRLGLLLKEASKLDEAARFLELAAAAARSEKNWYYSQRYLGSLGSVLRDRGQMEEALHRYGEALDIAERIGSAKAMAILLDNIGAIQAVRGDLEGAEASFRRAQWIDEHESVSEIGAAKSRGNLALLYRMADKSEQAEVERREVEKVLSRSEVGRNLLEKFNESWRRADEGEQIMPGVFL